MALRLIQTCETKTGLALITSYLVATVSITIGHGRSATVDPPQWVVEEYLYLLYDAVVRHDARYGAIGGALNRTGAFSLTDNVPVPYAA